MKAAGRGGGRSQQPEAFRAAQCEGNARLTGKLRTAVLRERGRMARDIHDIVAQGFTGIIIQAEAAEDSLQRGDSAQAGFHIRRLGKLAREGLAEARRSVQALRPGVLEEQTLRAALKQLIRRMTPGSGLRGSLRCSGHPRTLPPQVAENLLRIGQEALTNTLKHARASHFEVRLCFGPGEVRLELFDNGRGFDPATATSGLGLLGMKERMARLGGQLQIDSRPGRGSRITVAVPGSNHPSPA